MTDVTVVIPTRERADHLRVALHSILASAAEAKLVGISTRILVIDDASPTEATAHVCEELGVEVRRIEVHDGRDDPAAAIALGVSAVESTWFSLFGDDDVMLPRFIRAHVEALRAGEGFDVCTASYRLADAALVPTAEVTIPEVALGDLLLGTVTVNDGAMTRTALAQALDWDPTLGRQILFPIWLSLVASGARFTRLTEPMFLYRRHGSNISRAKNTADLARRLELAAPMREAILARDGILPAPTRPPSLVDPPPKPPPKPPHPRWRRIGSRVKRTLLRIPSSR